MAEGKCIAVYCGSSLGKRPEYSEKAAELGACLASRGIKIVFGGSGLGLLGVMGNAAIAAGGKTLGIVPELFLKMDNYVSCGEEIIVKDMHTRKKMIFDMADGFIALPGGIGTMEELTEILTWSKLDIHSRPVALLNVSGYYNTFIQWIKRGIEDGFIYNTPTVEELLIVDTEPESLVNKLCSLVYCKGKNGMDT